MEAYEDYIALSRYARHIESENRRETWEETVSRYLNFFEEHLAARYPQALETYKAKRPHLEKGLLRKDVMGSMRAMMTAGEALHRDHAAGYNCAYLPVDSISAFKEAMYCLLCGTGVGFSVEKRYVSQLPQVPREFVPGKTIVVHDSKYGWANALEQVLMAMYRGEVPEWDLSKIRPAGARLKTFGGRASGPEPLERLLEFTKTKFYKARGRKLTPLEVHDILCKVGEVVVVGGVRRSAMISLSDLDNEELAAAKAGEWWRKDPQRALANNSAVFNGRPEAEEFWAEWTALKHSGSGERGIFNREACKTIAARSKRLESLNYGTNPCSEIILRPREFCNLSEVVIRSLDSYAQIAKKVELATIMGTLQSTLTEFPFLPDHWAANCKEERLLGVSLTGIMDHLHYGQPSAELADDLCDLREHARKVNAEWAALLGIRESAAITCVKPSGTVSQLCNSASGIHPRFARHYIRRVRGDKKDPLTQWLINQGVPHEECVYQGDSTVVFEFPIEAPPNCTTREEVSALDQLELWLCYQKNWCEHKPSVTIQVRDSEWDSVGQWVWEHFEWVSGIAFLPYDGGTYQQAPYEEISQQDYEILKRQVPHLDVSKFREEEDNSTASQELACVGGSCEL